MNACRYLANGLFFFRTGQSIRIFQTAERASIASVHQWNISPLGLIFGSFLLIHIHVQSNAIRVGDLRTGRQKYTQCPGSESLPAP